MRPLTKLERYGWERMAQFRLLLTVGEAAMLAHMVIEASGRIAGKDALHDLRGGRKSKIGSMRNLSKPIARIRGALADVGIADAIEAHDRIGYSVYADLIPAIRDFVEAE